MLRFLVIVKKFHQKQKISVTKGEKKSQQQYSCDRNIILGTGMKFLCQEYNSCNRNKIPVTGTQNSFFRNKIPVTGKQNSLFRNKLHFKDANFLLHEQNSCCKNKTQLINARKTYWNVKSMKQESRSFGRNNIPNLRMTRSEFFYPTLMRHKQLIL